MVTIAFITWLILGFGLFFVLPPRQAVLAGLVFAFLFLPSTPPDIWALRSRTAIICLPLLLGSVFFAGKAWGRARFCFVDLAMVAWCLWPLVSSLTNGFSLYSSIADANLQLQEWGLPYLLGRIFFFRLEHLRSLAIAIFVGGLVYVPLCLWEIRMSPQLHTWVYGFYPSSFAQAYRYGGFRPTVFLGHGLGVAVWMSFAGLTGFWLWSSRSLRALGRIATGPLLAVLVATLVLCKSLGPIAVFAIGTVFKTASKLIRSSALIWLLLSLPTIYVVVRIQGKLSTATVNAISSENLDQERSDSFMFRLINEDLFVKKALERPLLGWGPWDHWRPKDRFGHDIVFSDALWTIVFSEYGFSGLIILGMVLCLPVLVFLRRYPWRLWSHPKVAPAAALATFLALSQIDGLFNAFSSTIVMVAAGGITAAAFEPLRQIHSKRAVTARDAIPREPAQSPG